MNCEEMEAHFDKYLRNRSRRSKIDLNAISIIDNQGPKETSVNLRMQIEPMSSQGGNGPPTFIDLEAISDDVIISSPRSFAEAKKNSSRNHGRPVVVDLDSEDRATPLNQSKHGRSFSKIHDLHTNAPAPSPPPLAKPPSYNCPVCLSSLVEETSTKCGHIFCNKCIKTAIETKNICPTCRRKVNKKDLIRVYLPASS